MRELLTVEQKREIDKKVKNYLKDSFVPAEGGIIDISMFARSKGFAVQLLNMNSKTTGILLINKEAPKTKPDMIIAVRDGMSAEKSRFIIARELGVFCLQAENESQFAHKSYLYSSRDIDEQKADYFARAILIPENTVKQYIKELKGTSEYEIVYKLADKFKVTKQVAYERYFDIICVPDTSLSKI